ncbi:EAL domain-containing protein [Paucibacter sp. APW11]|uniref:EAL domain-containing protein n=1 Tax=Roseateles aquae TaxID=3077235 RepID=A0ABU3PC51_9BURK|nr:EAL domain-containing protein [Paucibacter sp. APW11]MDT9000143.1 EAL domain-containing protein [Paucibacter sp. APW11]
MPFLPLTRILLRLRIGTRLVLSSAALILLLVVPALAMLARLEQLSQAFEQLSSQRLLLLRLAGEINLHANDAARKLLVLISAPRPQRVEAYAAVDSSNRKIDEGMKMLAARLPGGQANASLRELEGSLAIFRRAYDSTVDLIEAEDVQAAREMMAQETELTLGMLSSAAERLLQVQQAEMEGQAKRLQRDIQQDRWMLLGLCGAAALLGGLVALSVRRSITIPLGETEAAARRMAEGDYNARAPLHGGDEVARLAGTLNGLAEAVSEREQRIMHLANTDAMTGLAQRARFIVEANESLHQHLGKKGMAALLCLDLDRLKTINALIGFDAGDAVIRLAAERLAEHLGPTVALGRLAGGTFAALAPVRDAAAARTLAEELRLHVERPTSWMGQTLDLSISCGVALAPEHGKQGEALLRLAEQALYDAKRQKTGLRVFSAMTEVARQQDLTLASQLQQAMQENELRAYLQPKLCLRSGELVGCEALIRWVHPERGLVPPVEFIPFAERTGRISQLTRWMLAEALRLMAECPLGTLSIAVNISTHDLHDRELFDHLRDLLWASHVEPQRLTLELTESGLMDSDQDPVALLQGLRTLGVRLAIDDFGTGHSSLAYLQRLPVDELKIDRSFVSNVDLEPRSYELLETIVRLGHSLGLSVTAEGIEREGELDALRRAGCDVVQGYLLGRPMPVDKFMSWRSEHKPRS